MAPIALTAAAVDGVSGALPGSWDDLLRQLAWAAASALIAVGVEWVRRALTKTQAPPTEQNRNPPT